jgi:hypothetical protein
MEKQLGKKRSNDALPSPWLNPSWVQVNQTVKMFGTQGMLLASNTKRGRGRAEAPGLD